MSWSSASTGTNRMGLAVRGLEERAFIVTGGGSGIGRGACERLAQASARIAVVDRDEASAAGVAERLRASGAQAHAWGCDVTSERAVAEMVEAAVSELGPLRGLITSAGVNLEADRHPLAEASVDAFREVLEINLVGTFVCVKYAIPQLLKAGGGSIVTIASTAGIRGGQGRGFGYTASKGGVVALTQQLSSLFGGQGIRANCLCPGATASEGMGSVFKLPETQEAVKHLIPMARVGQAEEVGAAAVMLLSDEASYVNGQILAADGGATAR